MFTFPAHYGGMRQSPAFTALLALPLLFAACSAWIDPSGGFMAANVASVMVFGRTVPDLVVSGVTGLDCSVVRLEQGHSYCRKPDPPPLPPPFCTRSLGWVDCWADPAALSDHPRGLADGPAFLTPAQQANRSPRWPEF